MDTQEVAEFVRRCTDEELADTKAKRHGNDLMGILIDQEIARRERLHQHELDLKLIADQVRWMKFATILTAATTLMRRLSALSQERY